MAQSRLAWEVPEMTYTVVVMREDDGRYTAFAPALNDCASFGDTREEALVMVADAMSLYVETLREHGWPVPDDNPHTNAAAWPPSPDTAAGTFPLAHSDAF